MFPVYDTIRKFMTALTSNLPGSTSHAEAASRARDEVHTQLAEARSRVDLLERRLKASTEEHSKLREEMSRLQAENQNRAERSDKLRERIDSLRVAKAGADEGLSKISEDRDKWKESFKKLEDQKEREIAILQNELKGYGQSRKNLEASQKNVGELARELQHLRTAYTNKESLLTTRTSELRAAEAFLNKSDAISYGDVQRMLEHLNAQIFQLAALITDGTTFCDGRPDGHELEAPYKKTKRWLGLPLAERLRLSSHADDPTWVQMALQAIAVGLGAWIINAWDVKLDNSLNALLTNIHQILFERGKSWAKLCTEPKNLTLVPSSEPQAISARWRVLSRRCTKELATPCDIVAEATEHLLDSLHCVLRISGAGGIGDSKSWGMAFADRARDIAVQCMAVQKAIGEDVASSDFQLICPSSNELYDTAIMEDIDNCGHNKRLTPKDGGGLPVLCTIELGLRRCEKVEAEGGEIQVATMMKAKVALQDQLQ